MRLLADMVLLIHAAVALFITGGFIAVWVGQWRGWGWVRNRRFRQLHLAAIGFVAITSLIGVACPLTDLEDSLRGGAVGSAGFIQRWVGRLLYHDFPGWLFTIAYTVFALAVIVAWCVVPPRQKR